MLKRYWSARRFSGSSLKAPRPSKSQACSIGLRWVDCSGHSNSEKSFSWNTFMMSLAVCARALSCIQCKPSSICSRYGITTGWNRNEVVVAVFYSIQGTPYPNEVRSSAETDSGPHHHCTALVRGTPCVYVRVRF